MISSDKKQKHIIARDDMDRRAFLRTVGLAAGAAGALLILPGCAPDAAPGGDILSVAGLVDTSRFTKDPPWVIGRSGMGEVNSWQVMATNHFDYFVNQKYEGLFSDVLTASAFFDPAQQISDMEDLLTRDLDIMLVQPVTGGNITAQIEEAMDRGIPVVLTGARAYTDNYISYLDRDNPGVGRLYTNWIADRLGGKGKVAVMMGLPGNTYAEDVLRGVRDTLATYPDMEEVALGYGVWSPVEGKTAMEAMLASTDQIDGI
ncbi:MAG: substrate-binding domain-containing protein, partial [Pirellulaceae bacterium]